MSAAPKMVLVDAEELEELIRKVVRAEVHPQDEILTRETVAKMLHVNERTVVNYVEREGLPGYRLSKNAWRFLKHEIEEWRSRCKKLRLVAPVGPRVYFARSGRFIKIGFSEDVRARLAQLQTACAQPVSLLGCIAGSLQMERALHERFTALRVQGEWFRRGPELLAFIRDNARPV